VRRAALGLALLLVAGVAGAQGELLKQVRDSGRSAAQLNQEREQRFARERDAQARLLAEARAEARRHEGRVAAAKQRWESARVQSAALEKKLAAATRELETLYDAVRGAAVDLHDTAQKSLVTAQFPDRMETIAPLAATQTLPGPAELETLWRALQLEMQQTGVVVTFTPPAAGEGAARPELTRLGVFSAIADGRYFVLAAGGRQLLEMEPQPPRRFRTLAREFDKATRGYVPMLLDPSRGTLLVAEANRPGLFGRLWHSGVGGYFIAAILLIALVLAVAQAAWLRWRVILDEQSIGVTAAVLLLFAIAQWWIWSPGQPEAKENVAMVELVSDAPPEEEEALPEPELTPPPPPPSMPSAATDLASLPQLAAPGAAPVVSNIQLPVKIGGGGSLTGSGLAGFARGSGQGFGTGQGFKGKPLIPLSTARPQMPEWACKQRIKGWVEAVFTVLPNGRVQDVKIVDAQPRGVYEIAAIESIGNWIYAETDRAREVKQRVPMDPADCAFNWR
jgi:periplasmic protein TonB